MPPEGSAPTGSMADVLARSRPRDDAVPRTAHATRKPPPSHRFALARARRRDPREPHGVGPPLPVAAPGGQPRTRAARLRRRRAPPQRALRPRHRPAAARAWRIAHFARSAQDERQRESSFLQRFDVPCHQRRAVVCLNKINQLFPLDDYAAKELKNLMGRSPEGSFPAVTALLAQERGDAGVSGSGARETRRNQPAPASSGQESSRHRINRGGHHGLNAPSSTRPPPP